MLNTYLMTALAKVPTKMQATPELGERARSSSTAGVAGRVVIKVLICSALLAVSLSGAVHDVMSNVAVNQGLFVRSSDRSVYHFRLHLLAQARRLIPSCGRSRSAKNISLGRSRPFRR